MSFVLPIYSKRIGGDALAIGGLSSIFSFMTLILRPLIGKGIDRYGRKKFFTMAFLFYSISMLLYSYSTNMGLLYVSRLIQAIGSSFMWISVYSIAVDISDREKRGKAVGQVDAAISKGALYGALIGFTILANMSLAAGWSLLFKGYAVLSIIAGLLTYKLIPETKTVKSEDSQKSDAGLGKNFIMLLCIVFISAISSSMLSPLLMVYLQDRYTTEVSLLAIAFIPASLVYAFLPAKLGGISDKIGRTIPMAIGFVGSGIVSLGFARALSIEILVLLWVLESIGVVMASPAQEALVADLAGEDARGSAYGIYLFTASLGAVFGPLLGGWIYDSLGHTVPFYLNSVMLVFNACLVIVFFRNNKGSLQQKRQSTAQE
jgi:MFS family permease